MYYHIDFVESVYEHVKAPMYFIVDILRPIASKLQMQVIEPLGRAATPRLMDMSAGATSSLDLD